MRVTFLAVPGLAVSTSLLADTIYLKEGGSVDGQMRRSDNGWEVTTSSGKTVFVPEGQVGRIELAKPKASDADQALSQLLAVRRMADAQADLNIIIARYETLVKQLGSSPVAGEARKELAMWRERQASGMIKVGQKWVTRNEASTLDEQAFGLVEQAHLAVKQARFPEAGKLVDQALALDPTNAGALYLRGILLMKQDQLGQARKAFEAAGAVVPDHGPTLNNMAVTQWRQRAYGQALVSYEKALAAMPMTPLIHDNIAEALNNPPRDVARSPALRRLTQKWELAEGQLQKDMSQHGWFRWGSTWVTAEQQTQLKEQEQAITKRLEELSSEFDTTQAKIERIDEDIASTQRAMTSIEATRISRDEQGRVVRSPMPTAWYDMQRDLDRLEALRRVEVRRLDTLKAEAERVRGQMSVPPYSGNQRIMEEEFVPVSLRKPGVAAATTAPATQPVAEPAE